MQGKFVSYLRVSTARQGASGLGLEAQRKAVEDYLNGGCWSLLAEYVEVESGKRSENRPKLLAALAHCAATGAKLLIARLDRLARNVRFIATVMEADGVEFVACDMPMANNFTIHILAAVAEYEGKAISERTKAGLAAAKARGVKLGNAGKSVYALRAAGAHQPGWRAGADGYARTADAYAAKIVPIIEAIRAEGTTGLHAIARELTARGILTPRGGAWNASRVRVMLSRGAK
jgi:DNA invertase Pin-like site-specific DNA recombinase